MNNIEKNIQAFLLFRGGSIPKKIICSTLKITESDLEVALTNIKQSFENTGLSLIDNSVNVAIATNESTEPFISKLRESEYTSDLSRPAKEILSLVMYAGPLSKQDIDFLRGVNSQFILKKLILRGLIKDEENIDDKRAKVYRITVDFMTHLGITEIEKLPDYEGFRSSILSSLEEIKIRVNID